MSRNKLLIGAALIFLGLILMARSLDIFYFSIGNLFSDFWPLLLIGTGFWLIIRKNRMIRQSNRLPHTAPPSNIDLASPSANFESTQQQAPPRPQSETSSNERQQTRSSQSPSHSNGKTNYSKFIGDMKINLKGQNIRSVEVSTFIGDTDLFLADGIMEKGLNRIIFSGFIGDTRIFVPKDIPVFVHSSNFVGDIEIGSERSSGFGNTLDWQTENYNTAESKVYIALNLFLGDLTVYFV